VRPLPEPAAVPRGGGARVVPPAPVTPPAAAVPPARRAAPSPGTARPILAAAILCAGMVLIPLLALRGGSTATSKVAAGRPDRVTASTRRPVSVDGEAPPATLLGIEAAAVASAAPATFATPLAAASQAPVNAGVVAARAALLAPPPATPHPPKVALVVPRSVPAPAVVGPPRLQAGVASWYWAPSGTCAHPTLPFGTILHVYDFATGRTTTCRVDDRGPYAGGRVVDLAPDVFARLEPVTDGVAHVRISW
jgi:rare lipoprotein A